MKAKHTKTLCKGCLHGLEHHKDRGPCTYGHTTATGGCRCPAFNTPKHLIPGASDDRIQEVVKLLENAAKLLSGPAPATEPEAIAETEAPSTPASLEFATLLEQLRLKLQGALDEFSQGVLELVSPFLRGGVASTEPPPVDVVRSRGRARGKEDEHAPPSVTAAEKPSEPAPVSTPSSAPPQGELGPISQGAIAILAAITSSKRPCSSAKIELLTGYKSTMRSQYLGELRRRGLIDVQKGLYVTTDAGLLTHESRKAIGEAAVYESMLSGLSEGARKMFDAIAAAGEKGATDAMLELETGYKSTMRSQYRSQLATVELVKITDGRWRLTEDGLEELGGKWPVAKKGDELLEHVRSKLSEGAAFMLDAVAFNPPVTMHELGVATGYKSTMLSTYI